MRHDFTTPTCCKQPAVAVMDYTGFTSDTARVNRCCTRCWTHWFGPVGQVKQFTRAEWDALVSAPEKVAG